MRNGSHIMIQCLCNIKTYISTYFFSHPRNKFLSSESNTIFLPKPIFTIKYNTMFSETSIPYTLASATTSTTENETVTLADKVKKYKTDALIEFLQKEENLELEEEDLEIIHKQRVNSRDFLKLTEEKLFCHPYNLPGGPASRLADFVKKCKEKKLRSFFSYCSLKEVLADYGYNYRSDSPPAC